jgi:hypothetical protein
MPDDWRPRRLGTWQRVPAGWRLAGAAALLLVVFAAVGLGTATRTGGAGQAHRGLVRAEATAVTIAIGWTAVVAVALAVWALTMKGGPPTQRPVRQQETWVRRLAVLTALVVLAFLVAGIVGRHHASDTTKPASRPAPHELRDPTGPGVVDPRTVAIGLLVAIVLTVVALVAFRQWERRRLARLGALRTGADDAAVLADAIDAAIDDLEAEPDPRQAVIAAYARMERALREHGIPRWPWEAPTEYLGRVLLAFGGHAPAVGRLTELFQVAKFSAHPVDEAMKGEALAALHELRAGLAVPA